ncbi:type II toxin-antitoxin system VapC family toxin [bacterium]|nr:type II toxin-antitoxin system VapC family toxin [bacterium]
MNILLDTHVCLWWLDNSTALKKEIKDVISNIDNVIIVSAVVIWEIRIKQAIGKLEIPPDFFEVLTQQGFEIIPIAAEDAYKVGDLPLHHRDPFDRMLIAQAKSGGFTILTHDKEFTKYDVPILTA